MDQGREPTPDTSDDIKPLRLQLERYVWASVALWTVVVGAGYEGQTNRLRELLKDLDDRYKNLLIMTLDLSEGFYSPRMKYIFGEPVPGCSFDTDPPASFRSARTTAPVMLTNPEYRRYR